MTFVANCRDIFFPVPFPPSPFGFRRFKEPSEKPQECPAGRLLEILEMAEIPQKIPPARDSGTPIKYPENTRKIPNGHVWYFRVSFLGNTKNQPEVFQTEVRAGCPCENACFFQDLEGLSEVFGRMSAGISGPKLPLWAEFSFLIFWYLVARAIRNAIRANRFARIIRN